MYAEVPRVLTYLKGDVSCIHYSVVLLKSWA